MVKKIEDYKSLTLPNFPSPTSKKKIFGVRSEILIKYKKLKWTPNRKASHLLPGGYSRTR